MEKVTVIGGGNIGTQFACTAAAKGMRVTVYTQKPEKYSGLLQITDGQGALLCEGMLAAVTDDLALAVKDAEVIFVTYPAFLFPSFSKQLEPLIRPGQKLGIIPGTGGAEFAFRGCIEKGAVLFGLQRVPCVARLAEYGKRVCVEGKRDRLFAAAVPGQFTREICDLLGGLFDMPCLALPNYLSVTMTPSNPILHTTRLRTLFSDYAQGAVYPKNPLFYGEWDLPSSRLLLACDEEHQRLLRSLSPIDLTQVRSLREHYESETAEALTAKLCSIKSLHGLSSPMVRTERGWIPDFSSRYFTADFPYGLAVIEALGRLCNSPMPHIGDTMEWYRRVTGQEARFDLDRFGICSKDDLIRLYCR